MYTSERKVSVMFVRYQPQCQHVDKLKSHLRNFTKIRSVTVALFLAPRHGRIDTTRLVAAIGNFFAKEPRNGSFKNTVQRIK